MTISASEKRIVSMHIRKMADAQAIIKDAEQDKKNAKEAILPILQAHEMKSYKNGYGTVTRAVSKGSTISKDKLVLALATRGIDADIIAQAIEESERTWESEYLRLTVGR